MLMCQNEHGVGARIVLWSALLFYFYLVCLLLMGFLLFVPLTSSVLGLRWHK